MKKMYAIVAAVLVTAGGLAAQATEEVPPYLVAPFTLNKTVTVTMADGRKLAGKVVRGDDDKIFVGEGTPVEVATSQIASVQFRRRKRSSGGEFAGSLIGGVGLGMGGAAIGRAAAESIRSDGSPGRVGPIVGGIVLGFVGGQIGRQIARHAATQEVTLKVVEALSGQPPKPGETPLPAAVRLEPSDLRR